MNRKPILLAGIVLSVIAAVVLFVLPNGAQTASMISAFALATGLALIGSGYALKT